MALPVILDFESYSCADLQKVGAWRYAEDVSTGILCLGYKTIAANGTPAPTRVITEGQIRGFDPELLALVNNPDIIFSAHNAHFEQAIWKHVMVGQYGWPPLPPERWHDTMAVAARMTLPLGLDRVGKALNLEVQKDGEGHRLMLQMCKPGRDGNFDHALGKMARLAQYNVGDVDTQYHLHVTLGGLGASERKVWLLDQKANQRGITVDVPYVRQCMGVLEAARTPMEAEFRAATGFSPTQRAKILEWVQGQGVALPDMKKATLDAILDPEEAQMEDNPWLFEELPPHVLRVVQLRRILASSSVAKLGRMLETVNLDGRIRGTMQYHGARTGRNAGRLVQPLNMPKPIVKGMKQREIMELIRSGDLRAIEEQCGNAFDAVISTLRGCFKPAKGHIFAAGDFNAIEARVVLALAGEYDRASAFDTGDAYSDMAAKIYGYPVKKPMKERDLGKAVVLGAGFGMGFRKFRLVAAPTQDEDFARSCIDAYRKDFAPLVPKLWYGLEKASADAVWCNARRAYEFRNIRYQLRDEYLVCTLPSGREIYYHRPRKEQAQVPWDPEKLKPSWSFISYQNKGSFRKHTFGGLLTENVVQATARDIMVEAMFRAEDAGLPLVFTVYDELVTEPLESVADAAKILQQVMEERSAWVREYRIPIAAECEILTEYQK